MRLPDPKNPGKTFLPQHTPLQEGLKGFAIGAATSILVVVLYLLVPHAAGLFLLGVAIGAQGGVGAVLTAAGCL